MPGATALRHRHLRDSMNKVFSCCTIIPRSAAYCRRRSRRFRSPPPPPKPRPPPPTLLEPPPPPPLEGLVGRNRSACGHHRRAIKSFVLSTLHVTRLRSCRTSTPLRFPAAVFWNPPCWPPAAPGCLASSSAPCKAPSPRRRLPHAIRSTRCRRRRWPTPSRCCGQARSSATAIRFVSCVLTGTGQAGRPRLHKPGQPLPRRAFLVLLDNATGTGYEAVVDLASKSVIALRRAAQGRPARRSCSTSSASARRRSSVARVPGGAEEARRRPTSSLVMVEPWSAGNYGTELRRGQGPAADAGPVLRPLRAEGQRLRPAARRRRRRRRSATR